MPGKGSTTEMHLHSFYIYICMWFCFVLSVYVSTDAYCGQRTTSEVSTDLPPCLEAESFVAFLLWTLGLPVHNPRNSPLSTFHLLMGALEA